MMSTLTLFKKNVEDPVIYKAYICYPSLVGVSVRSPSILYQLCGGGVLTAVKVRLGGVAHFPCHAMQRDIRNQEVGHTPPPPHTFISQFLPA